MYIVGLDKPPSLSTSETAQLQQTIQDLHKLQASQRQEIVQRDTQIEKLVGCYRTQFNHTTKTLVLT